MRETPGSAGRHLRRPGRSARQCARHLAGFVGAEHLVRGRPRRREARGERDSRSLLRRSSDGVGLHRRAWPRRPGSGRADDRAVRRPPRARRPSSGDRRRRHQPARADSSGRDSGPGSSPDRGVRGQRPRISRRWSAPRSPAGDRARSSSIARTARRRLPTTPACSTPEFTWCPPTSARSAAISRPTRRSRRDVVAAGALSSTRPRWARPFPWSERSRIWCARAIGSAGSRALFPARSAF